MNLINAKYGNVSGLKGYSHGSDQYAPLATQVLPATVSEAPYILDGLLMNDAGRRVRQHFADTGGFTDHVFAACALLGYRRSEEHTSELQSLMRISYAGFCLHKKKLQSHISTSTTKLSHT